MNTNEYAAFQKCVNACAEMRHLMRKHHLNARDVAPVLLGTTAMQCRVDEMDALLQRPQLTPNQKATLIEQWKLLAKYARAHGHWNHGKQIPHYADERWDDLFLFVRDLKKKPCSYAKCAMIVGLKSDSIRRMYLGWVEKRGYRFRDDKVDRKPPYQLKATITVNDIRALEAASVDDADEETDENEDEDDEDESKNLDLIEDQEYRVFLERQRLRAAWIKSLDIPICQPHEKVNIFNCSTWCIVFDIVIVPGKQ